MNAAMKANILKSRDIIVINKPMIDKAVMGQRHSDVLAIVLLMWMAMNIMNEANTITGPNHIEKSRIEKKPYKNIW